MLAATFGAAGNVAKKAVIGTDPRANVPGGAGTCVNGCQLFTFVMEEWWHTYSEEGAIRSEVPGAGLAKDPDAMIRIWELGYPDEIASVRPCARTNPGSAGGERAAPPTTCLVVAQRAPLPSARLPRLHTHVLRTRASVDVQALP